jgi:predicted alpha-1,6-mannanase (GH76 family)
MRSLFDENGKYLPWAQELSDWAEQMLMPAMRKYLHDGFSIRDISHVVMLAAHDAELELILEQEVEQNRTQD